MSKRIARLAMLISVALVLSAIERFFPLPIAIPGIKLGLANLVTVLALYLYGARDACIISTLRVGLAGFLFGSVSSMLYALSGALCAFCIMALLKRTKHFGVVGVSVAGGIMHNIAQIFMAAVVVRTIGLAYYLPVLIVSGVITGFFIGVTSGLLLKRLDGVS